MKKEIIVTTEQYESIKNHIIKTEQEKDDTITLKKVTPDDKNIIKVDGKEYLKKDTQDTKTM